MATATKATTRALADRVLAALYAREPHAKVVVAATGGGTSAAELLFRAGSSSTMLQFTVPYARASLQSYLQTSRDATAESAAAVAGVDPPRPTLTHFCSQETAERMAVAAWHQAQDILRHESDESDPLHAHALPATLRRFRQSVGVACTAALATTYAKRGPHECFVSICRAGATATTASVGRPDTAAPASVPLPAPLSLLRPQCETFHLSLSKAQQRSRSEEDQIVSHWLVYLLAKALDVDSDATRALYDALVADQRDDDDALTAVDGGRAAARDAAAASRSPSPSELLEGICASESPSPHGLTSVAFVPPAGSADDEQRDGAAPPQVTAVRDLPFRGVVLSGSFNPLHAGHVQLALAAQQLVQRRRGGADVPLAFELAVANADKGAIAASTVLARVAQFTAPPPPPPSGADKGTAMATATDTGGPWPVLVTNATLFSQKAALLPGCVFVIGADTATRIVDAKYYGGDAHRMVLTLAQIARCGCSFVVAGRVESSSSSSSSSSGGSGGSGGGGTADGTAGARRFISADAVVRECIPPVFSDLFVPLPESVFRSDVSSTQLRQQQEAQATRV